VTTARDEILSAMRSLRSRHGRDVFKLDEIGQEVFARGSLHAESTIRTHIVSKLCVDGPQNHAVVYGDFERVSPGHYRLRGGWGTRNGKNPGCLQGCPVSHSSR